MSILMESAKDNGWQITAYALEDDAEAMFEDLKTRLVKNIVFYAGFEENIKPTINAVSPAISFPEIQCCSKRVTDCSDSSNPLSAIF